MINLTIIFNQSQPVVIFPIVNQNVIIKTEMNQSFSNGQYKSNK